MIVIFGLQRTPQLFLQIFYVFIFIDVLSFSLYMFAVEIVTACEFRAFILRDCKLLLIISRLYYIAAGCTELFGAGGNKVSSFLSHNSSKIFALVTCSLQDQI